MRILVHDYAGHPFQIQLSRYLAVQGYEVLHLYAGYNATPRGLLSRLSGDPIKLSIKGIFIHDILNKNSFVKRWFQEQEYGKLLENEIERFRPDVVISANTPLDAQARAIRTCQRINSKFIFWLQDFIGFASYLILRRKLPGLGHIIGKYYIRLEKQLLKDSDNIVTISEDFIPFLLNFGVTDNRISVIHNWAPLEEISPRPKDNSWARAHGNLQDRFIFLYTGTLGMKHNPAVLLSLARSFMNDKDVSVFVISETIGADWLIRHKKLEHLENIEILNYQPYEILSDVFGTGDVLVAILEKDAGTFSIPSKVLTYLCSQRPLLLSVPLENMAARIVMENQLGIIVPPNNDEEFIAEAHKLRKNSSQRDQFGRNARQYAEQNFIIDEIASRFLTIIN
jgi:colanic acid biosynthesis glycosyl transferase WcaI